MYGDDEMPAERVYLFLRAALATFGRHGLVEGPPHYHPPPWPRQPRAPCPTLPSTPYYFYTDLQY